MTSELPGFTAEEQTLLEELKSALRGRDYRPISLRRQLTLRAPWPADWQRRIADGRCLAHRMPYDEHEPEMGCY